jgi:hypothetical protein
MWKSGGQGNGVRSAACFYAVGVHNTKKGKGEILLLKRLIIITLQPLTCQPSIRQQVPELVKKNILSIYQLVEQLEINGAAFSPKS